MICAACETCSEQWTQGMVTTNRNCLEKKRRRDMENWTREGLKISAKQRLQQQYWKFVLLALILALVTGGISNASGRVTGSLSKSSNSQTTNTKQLTDNQIVNRILNEGTAGSSASTILHAVTATSFSIFLLLVFIVAAFISILLSIFLINPVIVGGCGAFDKGFDEEPNIRNLVSAFGPEYKNTVLTMFLRDLFTNLWMLLLVVPGIIKHYEYKCIPYLLAENPSMNYSEAFAESRRLMDGHKMDAFVLDLSFIGWELLTIIPLVGILWVNPYYNLTWAAFYRAVSNAEQRRYHFEGYSDPQGSSGYNTWNDAAGQNPYGNGQNTTWNNGATQNQNGSWNNGATQNQNGSWNNGAAQNQNGSWNNGTAQDQNGAWNQGAGQNTPSNGSQQTGFQESYWTSGQDQQDSDTPQ